MYFFLLNLLSANFCYTFIKKIQNNYFGKFKSLVSNVDIYSAIMYSQHLCMSNDTSRCQDEGIARLSAITFIEPPPEIWLKTTGGLSNLLTKIIESSNVLANSNDSSTIDINAIWFLYSVIPEEVSATFKALMEVIRDDLINLIDSRNRINVQVIAITICYCVILFAVLMKVRSSLRKKYVRNKQCKKPLMYLSLLITLLVISMIPISFTKKSQAIRDLINDEYMELF